MFVHLYSFLEANKLLSLEKLKENAKQHLSALNLQKISDPTFIPEQKIDQADSHAQINEVLVQARLLKRFPEKEALILDSVINIDEKLRASFAKTRISTAYPNGTVGERGLNSKELERWENDPEYKKKHLASVLRSAAEKGDLDRLIQVIRTGFDINSHDSNGYTGLMAASLWDRDLCVEALLEAGSDPNGGANKTSIDESDNITPLMLTDSASCIKILLAAGADPHIISFSGKTALMFKHDPQCLEALLDAGSDPTARDGSQYTPIKALAELLFGSSKPVIEACIVVLASYQILHHLTICPSGNYEEKEKERILDLAFKDLGGENVSGNFKNDVWGKLKDQAWTAGLQRAKSKLPPKLLAQIVFASGGHLALKALIEGPAICEDEYVAISNIECEDEYVAISNSDEDFLDLSSFVCSNAEEDTKRFFDIALRLPLEMQTLLAYRAFRSPKETMPHKDSELAFRELARKLAPQ